MAIIVDADVIIQGEKGAFGLYKWLASRPDDKFELAASTFAEFWHGVERGTGLHKANRRRYFEALLESMPVVPYTEQTAYEHARLWAELESAGKMIGYYDLVVAATALERGSQLATFNARHFAPIERLDVIEPG